MLEPISSKNWNAETAALLLARAGFGGTPEQIAAMVRKGPERSVLELVDYEKIRQVNSAPAWARIDKGRRPGKMSGLSEAARRARRRQRRRKERANIQALGQWWLERMRVSRRPLQEKLTLFWHGHFATSFQKVKSAYCMWRQNQMLRKGANGNFRELVVGIAQDPAMLIYLDGARSRKRAPNENFARELMELFTMGEGNYTEEDIKASARAFAGWNIARDRFAFQKNTRQMDTGTKTFMGRTGNLTGEDIIDTILQQDATSRFIARKLWTFFAYEEPSSRLERALARKLKESNYELKPVLTTMFLSREFYGRKSLRRQVKGPVQFLVQSTKELDTKLPSAALNRNILNGLGQVLFAPPNVKGWDGGFSWITSTSITGRRRVARYLVIGVPRGKNRRSALSVKKILPASLRKDPRVVRETLQARLFGGSGLRAEDRKAFDALVAENKSGATWTDDGVRRIMVGMMEHVQYQLT